MSYEIINIPLSPATKSFNTEELNKFCLNKKIITTQVEFFQQDNSAFWTVFIEYDTILETIGKETDGLTEAGRICFEELRRWRKEMAEKEGIPPFVIAKNSHFIDIINKETTTIEALKQINGFGQKKIEKYGKTITGIITAFYKEKRK